MAITIQDKISKAKSKRSQSLMSKINILWTRDGHTAPDIESQKDIDFFNCQQLFGKSGTETIDYDHVGVEGLIRCYYQISYLISGTVRNNIIRSNNYIIPSWCACSRANLETAANLVLSGNPQNSGFFVTNADEARKGTFNLSDSSFMSNRDSNPASHSGLLIDIMNAVVTLIGARSALGVKIFSGSQPAIGQIINSGTMLGERNTDVFCRIYIPAGHGYDRYDYMGSQSRGGNHIEFGPIDYSSVSGGGGTEGEPIESYTDIVLVYKNGVQTTYDSITSHSGDRFVELNAVVSDTDKITVVVSHQNPALTPTSAVYQYGDGAYDSKGQTISGPSYQADPYKWDSGWTYALDNLKGKFSELISWIEKTKVADFSYFVNPNVIPGKTTNWSLQDGWIAKLNAGISAIDSFEDVLDNFYPYNGNVATTDPAGKTAIDSGLDSLKSSLSGLIPEMAAIHTTINPGNPADASYGSGFFGSPSDKGATLWGARAQWIKSVIDANEGSRVVLKGISSVISTMNASITKNEDDFVLYGITKQSVDWASSQAWVGGLTTPDILAIELHQIVDTRQGSSTFLELISDGYIVSWQGTAHATAYDIWRSLDWNGTTGTWTKILPSGNQFSVQTTNPDNGQVYNFYSDLSVNPDTGIKPYYKVKAYDSGGSGDYSRIPAESDISSPKNIDDFDGTGSSGTSYPSNGGAGGSSGSEDGSTTPTTGAVNWREPVVNYTALPMIGNRSGDVRLVVAEGSLYYWNNDDSLWEPLTGTGTTSSWKDPVETVAFLPTINNTDGDVRLVNNTGKLYRWDSESQGWYPIESSSSSVVNHSDLEDMPDASGVNADHDSRYYTENEIDTKMVEINEQLDALKYLIPENAAPLSGALKLTGRTYESAYLSHGYESDQRFVTLEPESYFQRIIKGGSVKLTAQLPDQEFNSADKGMLLLYVNGSLVDTFDLFNHFDESKRTTAQTYTPATGSHGYIKVTEVRMYNNYSKYQKGSFEINLDGTILVAGENSIKLVHSLDTTTHETPELIIFYDNFMSAMAINTFDIRQGRLISNKYLSGLRYYAVNDSLRYSFRVESLFNNTYIYPNQVHVDSSELAITPYWINHKSAGSSYLDFGQPFINAIMQSDEEKTIDVQNIVTSKPTVRTKAYNLKESSEFTYQENVLINTYTVKSTEKHEYFVDEAYRLPVSSYDFQFNDYKNQWNSAAAIGASDLQVFSGTLIYPRTNFSANYLPIQTQNYSGYSGDRSYIRAFIDPGVPHNNGILYIKGFNMNSYINVEIKLPGLTNWMNLTQLYNEADFNGEDVDGCLINHDQFYYEFTTGKYSTADSGYLLLVRITMTENNFVPIEEMSINW